ncbi:MAG: spore protease YyaC [Negativicutes bacterium]|nr:spore protease YyaC [Negativicutes bacterium]
MLSKLFSLESAQPQEAKINTAHPQATQEIALTFRRHALEAKAYGREIIILCIGTDRSTGDSLGPLTGTKLQTLVAYPHILGTLDDPVHATNLPATLDRIRENYHNPFIVAVDACLGRMENIGYVSIGRGSLKPGAAVNKDLPPVGDIYITGIVNVGGFMEHLVLQSTRLNLVMRMAETIAQGLSYCLRLH